MATPHLPDKSTTTNLLDQVRDKLRVKHYSIRTEQTYVDWIKRFIFFHGNTYALNKGGRGVASPLDR